MSEPRKRRAHRVETPDGDKYVRSLSGRERSQYMETFVGEGKTGRPLEADQYLVAMGLCTSDGLPAFSSFDESFAEVMEWGTEPDGAVILCSMKILELSGMKTGEVDKQEKNSEGSQSN